MSPYEPGNKEFAEHIEHHGDGAKDVAFEVEDLDAIVKYAKDKGGKILKDTWEERDENGTVRFCTLQTVSELL